MVERSFADPVMAEDVPVEVDMRIKKWWQERDGVLAIWGVGLALGCAFLLGLMIGIGVF